MIHEGWYDIKQRNPTLILLGKGWTTFSPSNGLNSAIPAFYNDVFGIKWSTKVDMILNKETQP